MEERTSFPSDLSVAEVLSLAKSRNIEAIQCTAHSMGLSADVILILIHEIESNELPISFKLELMHCLIPKESVPEAAFVKMTCLLSDFKLDLNLKVEIVKWMISVFAFAKSTKLQSFYEVFLQLLENETTLRPYICHLLHLITGKKEVTGKRINDMMQLLAKLEPEACLTSLLYLYSKLQPEMFGLKLDKGFQHDFESLGIYPELIKKVHGTMLNSQNYVFVGEKKYPVEDASFYFEMAEFNAIETLDTFAHSFNALYNEKDLLAYSSFEDIYKSLEILKKSHNIEYIFKSKYRRLHLTSNISRSVQISFFDCLLSSLCSDFDAYLLSDILEVIYEMQESNMAISDFIRSFIEFWDGYADFTSVLEIMSYHEICCFGKIHLTMKHIKELFWGTSAIYKCHCLYYFSKMYENWALMISEPQHLILCDHDCSMLSLSENDSLNDEYHLYENVVHNLGSYIDLICETLIFEPFLLNQVLLHYERISIVHMKNNRLVIHLPTSSVYFSALFSLNSYTLECFARLMLRENSEIHCLVANNHAEASLAAKFFKCCFVDVCDILWKGNFSTQSNKKTFLIKTPIMKRLKQLYPDCTSHFILHKHPALMLKTFSFLELNEPNSPSSSLFDMCNPDRTSYFRYLSENGFQAFVKLIYFFSRET